jgi:hypothetical protein
MSRSFAFSTARESGKNGIGVAQRYTGVLPTSPENQIDDFDLAGCRQDPSSNSSKKMTTTVSGLRYFLLFLLNS